MSTPLFTVPKFVMERKRTVDLNFSGAVAAGAFLSIVGGSIGYPFRVVKASMVFTDDANNLIQHSWYVARDRGVSVTGPPSGSNIFGRENPTAFFVGKALVKTIVTNIEFEEVPVYVKLYTANTGTYVYTINCSLTIQEL